MSHESCRVRWIAAASLLAALLRVSSSLPARAAYPEALSAAREKPEVTMDGTIRHLEPGGHQGFTLAIDGPSLSDGKQLTQHSQLLRHVSVEDSAIHLRGDPSHLLWLSALSEGDHVLVIGRDDGPTTEVHAQEVSAWSSETDGQFSIHPQSGAVSFVAHPGELSPGGWLFPHPPEFFRFYYGFDPTGWRYWTRETPMGWREIYADGTTNLFRTVEPVEIEGTHGTMIERGDFAESFIPDVGAASARFYFRTSPSRWVWLSDTKDAR